MGKASTDPKARVRKLMKAGKVKKKCCRSKPRCKRCPVLALQKAKADLSKAA
ncbi:MAG TPA: hypothetical protein VJT49_06350 [Amycolatopsis sp.]|uniref:hypothetical protein n=1 Tax=Amycolatopsis sp. TaxID=37632 RepID=UPI002B4768DC|nr:hypothetical protein [Amycolatopsis sp.]HKS44728.1 hypothetical protein [Amycolatopsis sp.]